MGSPTPPALQDFTLAQAGNRPELEDSEFSGFPSFTLSGKPVQHEEAQQEYITRSSLTPSMQS